MIMPIFFEYPNMLLQFKKFLFLISLSRPVVLWLKLVLIKVKSMHYCSCSYFLCALGSCPDGTVYQVWRTVGDFFQPWWIHYYWCTSSASITPSSPRCHQLHVLLLNFLFIFLSYRNLRSWILLAGTYYNWRH